jgi:hypothetical protein
MSCPYLEKGRMAYCHAFGGQRLVVESSESEAVCFSGDFSECSFLFAPLFVEYEKGKRPLRPGGRGVKGTKIG